MRAAQPDIAERRDHRVPGLDLLRSLAVLMVIASHFTNNMSFWYGLKPPQDIFFLGELGVELFFALSGFLIGRILIDIAARAPTWRNLWVFLVRRWMRTLPVYLVCLAALAAFFPPAAGLGGDLWRFATMTQNLLQPMRVDFWFSVSWSLTVEEWFYLLFGSTTIAFAMLVRRRWAILVPLAMLLVAPPILRLSVPAFTDYASGYSKMLPFRLDEIGYGVVMAWLYTQRSRVFDYPLPLLLVGIALILSAWFTLLPIPFRLFLVFRADMAVLGCALCIPAALPIHRMPGWLAFTAHHIARLSYALYLIHLTILVDVAQSLWFQGFIPPEAAVAIAVFGPLLVAELLSRCVEQPLMRRRPAQFLAGPTDQQLGMQRLQTH